MACPANSGDDAGGLGAPAAAGLAAALASKVWKSTEAPPDEVARALSFVVAAWSRWGSAAWGDVEDDV